MPESEKARYEHINPEHGRTLYTEPWWLDATCGSDNWEIFFFKDEDGNDIACLPYYTTKVGSIKAVITPPITQWMGLLEIKNTVSINLHDFIEKIKSTSIIDISLKSNSHLLNNPRNLTTNLKYSFVIPGDINIDTVRSNYNEGLRRNLKEAEKKYSVIQSSDIELLIQLNKTSYDQRKEKQPGWVQQIAPGVFNSLVEYNCGQMTFALHENKPVAGIMTGWDQRTEYYLLGGRNETAGASAHALLLDHAISHAVAHGRKFDFEGSMHPGIANFFQSFGAIPEPYLRLRRYRGAGKLWALLHR